MQSVIFRLRPNETRLTTNRDNGRMMRSTVDSIGADTKKQAYLYVGSCFITYVFTVISVVIGLFLSRKQPFVTCLLHGIFFPLQGFWNLLIFIRPRYNFQRNADPQKSACEILRIVIFQQPQNGLRSEQIPIPSRRKESNQNATSQKLQQEEKICEDEEDVEAVTMLGQQQRNDKTLQQMLEDLDNDIELSNTIQQPVAIQSIDERTSCDTQLERKSIPDIIKFPSNNVSADISSGAERRLQTPVSSLFVPDSVESILHL